MRVFNSHDLTISVLAGMVLLIVTSAGTIADEIDGGYAVVVSKTTQADPAWGKVVAALEGKYEAAVIEYEKDVNDALPALAKRFPRYACFIATRDEATPKFVAEVHGLTRRLDDDPYTDLLWGILTGFDAENALEIATTSAPLTVRRVASGTEVALEMCEEGIWYCELKKNHMVRKKKGGEPVAEKGPDDTTRALADTLNEYRADLFVTSGHATARDWQIGFRYRNGSFRSKNGDLYGLDTAGKKHEIDSPNPKVYMPIGNCLMGKIDGPDAMALAFMNSAGVRQMLGYMVPTWFGYGGWGCLDYFVEQPGRYTFAEAFHANHLALLHKLETTDPEAAKTLPGVGLRSKSKAAGLLFDRDVVAFYGDPAWEARLAPAENAWKQELKEKDGLYTFTITPNRGEKTFEPINVNGSQRGGRPIVQFLPHRVQDVKLIEDNDLKPLITDNFLLVPNPGKCDPDRTYRIVFRATPVSPSIEASGVDGGLVVHLGCGDGTLTAALHASDRYLVHGLDTDAGQVAEARAHIRSQDIYGPVSVDVFDGRRLPYVDNLVNLLVADELNGVTMEEVMRVLAPRGVALIGGEKTVKPRPEDIDDWTHALYNAGGNAVSKDRVVGPPRRLQWTAGPKWTRHHESMSSFQAMVSASGRVFYLIDEAPQVSLFLPSDWQLVARDAFNGKVLWKKKFKSWVTQLMNYKSGPTQSTRRLVAAGDRVFVTPGLKEGVHVLDASTGETLRVLKETAATEEILSHNGVLYLMTNDRPNTYPETTRFGRNDWRGQKKWIRAVDPETGKHLWDHETPVAPLSFAATDRGVFFHNGKQIVCHDLKTGEPLWQSEPVLLDNVIPTSNTPTLVPYDDVVLFIGGKDNGDYRGTGGHYVSQNLQTFSAVSAKTGKILWSYKVPRTGFECPKDILVLDKLVWIGAIFSGGESGAFTGRDLHTGKVVREFKPPWDVYWFHQRCFRSKATERFIMPSRTGTEFISPTKGWTSYNHWVRGACIYGSMPANGLLYQPPHPCGCYMESLLHGLNALAPAGKKQESSAVTIEADRLEKGPAYGRAVRETPVANDDWPTFRHDAQRSGYSAGVISAKLETSWKTDVGSTLTAVTIAGGKLFVADKDRHLVHALDVATGKPAWEFTTGGRVDSPPTIANGRVLFGCRDGYVYCLDAVDGQLVWRRRAAPDGRRLVADEQVESLWPVHGSVLVVDGKVYCVAGRSMFLDGGLRLLVLDAKTGGKITENTMDDVDPTTGKSLQLKVQDRNMPVAAPDLLSYDGKRIYMKSQSFSLDGKREDVQTTRDGKDQAGQRAHLFAPAGFLDDTAFHRVLMIYGKTFTGGASSNHVAPKYAPAGKMLVFDESRVYGFSRMPHLHRWVRELEFHIYAADKHRTASTGAAAPADAKAKNKRRGQTHQAASEPEHVHVSSKREEALAGVRKSLTSTAVNYRWSNHDPAMFGRAMALTGDALFVAGPPAIRNDNTADALRRWQGDSGGIVWALSRENGSKLAEYELPAPPVFDGMAAAGGRLYVALADGSVVCLKQQQGE